jgi:hypothetical protein
MKNIKANLCILNDLSLWTLREMKEIKISRKAK